MPTPIVGASIEWVKGKKLVLRCKESNSKNRVHQMKGPSIFREYSRGSNWCFSLIVNQTLWCDHSFELSEFRNNDAIVQHIITMITLRITNSTIYFNGMQMHFLNNKDSDQWALEDPSEQDLLCLKSS